MSGAFYTSLSGLLSFQKALDAVSNNVANINTLGYKGSDVFFRDLTSGSGSLNDLHLTTPREGGGAGVSVNGARRSFAQGELQETNNATDIAIDGNGFFIISDDDELRYTRAGQFSFNEDEVLVDANSGGTVMTLGDDGNLRTVSLAGLRSSESSSTTEVKFTGNLSLGADEHELSQVFVFDDNGARRTLRVKFTNNNETTAGEWSVEVFEEGADPITTGTIRFAGNGSPVAGANSLLVNLSNSESLINLDFGAPESFDGATSLSGGEESTLEAGDIDGRGLGALATVAFNDRGELVLSYSNGEEEVGPKIALAYFENVEQLVSIGNNSFVTDGAVEPVYGFAGEGAFGDIRPGSVELANVELSQEFADIIILQRGFQASSQILNVTNELIERLYNSTGGRGG